MNGVHSYILAGRKNAAELRGTTLGGTIGPEKSMLIFLNHPCTTVCMWPLWKSGYQARDFSTQEACEYVSRRLDAEADLAQFVVEQVGTRAMDLVYVCDECQGAASREEYQERVAAYRYLALGCLQGPSRFHSNYHLTIHTDHPQLLIMPLRACTGIGVSRMLDLRFAASWALPRIMGRLSISNQVVRSSGGCWRGFSWTIGTLRWLSASLSQRPSYQLSVGTMQ